MPICYYICMGDINIRSHDRNLKGYFLPSSKMGESPAVLMVHGWTSSKNGYIEAAKRLQQSFTNINFLAFDLGGHGESDGDINELTIHDHVHDVFSAFDFLKLQATVDEDVVGIVGSSYGAYLTAITSKAKNPTSVLLRVPAIYPNEMFNRNKGADLRDDEYRRTIPDRVENTALVSIKHFGGPVTIVESENDELVPQTVLNAYEDAVSENPEAQYLVMKGAGHKITTQAEVAEFDEIIGDWIERSLI